MSQVIEKYSSFQQSYHTGGDTEEYKTTFHVRSSLSGCTKVVTLLLQVLPKSVLKQQP